MRESVDSIHAQRARAAATAIVRILQEQGHVAYFAGGCVRDQIMKQTPTDYDVATDARPQRVKEIFRKAHYVGQAFGVMRVPHGEEWVEVATFRKETGHSDHRHPDHVEFTDAECDARRRDFTINGLFYDPIADRVIDFVHGLADIKAEVVRAIGNPRLRFAEDYLRMLRAVRFASRLGFSLDAGTAQAIRSHAEDLGKISRERIGQELQLMLEHASRAQAVRYLAELKLDGPVLQEKPVAMEARLVSHLPVDAGFAMALAAWALDRHAGIAEQVDAPTLEQQLRQFKTVQIVGRWRRALVLSNEQKENLSAILQVLPDVFAWATLTEARRKRLLAKAAWRGAREIASGIVREYGVRQWDGDAVDREAAEMLRQGVAPPPLVTGEHLIAMGLKPGPKFGPLLEQLYDAQLEGRVNNVAEAVALARRLFHGG